MDFSSGVDISALSAMLDESRTAVENGSTRQSQQPPMDLAPSRVIVGNSNKSIIEAGSSSSNAATNTKSRVKDIWQDSEIPSEDSIMSQVDGRPSPKYEFSYKQEVGTQDTFLGLNGRTPGSSDCSHLVCASCSISHESCSCLCAHSSYGLDLNIPGLSSACLH